MTAWESLLWSLWLPKVRSAIKYGLSNKFISHKANYVGSNDWHAGAPQAAVHLLESWESILPAFIRENVLDQLILPKVKKCVDEWDRPSQRTAGSSLAGIIFPWLPLLGERVEEILEGGKRRIRSLMRNWVVRDGVPDELARWKKDVRRSFAAFHRPGSNALSLDIRVEGMGRPHASQCCPEAWRVLA